MPEFYAHDRMSTRVFVCNCIPKFSEMLFNYDSESPRPKGRGFLVGFIH